MAQFRIPSELLEQTVIDGALMVRTLKRMRDGAESSLRYIAEHWVGMPDDTVIEWRVSGGFKPDMYALEQTFRPLMPTERPHPDARVARLGEIRAALGMHLRLVK